MKRTILALAFISLASPALAQTEGYTPLQQYLYNESGYAPPMLNQRPAPVPPPVVPYHTAAGDYYYPPAPQDAPVENEQINEGVRGMNFY